ncbi:hypothetical protein MMC16_005031 [Acarospora aff. strigata]|nr:hypothetical protein [Acarospora aff. strigata]
MSATFEVLTPSSVTSPASLAPAPPTTAHQPSTAPKALAPAPSIGANPTMLTTREWIIPPRPKPGRKPATDTPLTKRKAQNRAAQRAFRERRAAKVGELEEHIRKIEDEDEREQTELRSQIDRLEAEVEHYQEELLAWHQRCRGLEKCLETEKAEKQALEQELARPRNRGGEVTDAVPLPPRRSVQKSTITTQEQQSEPMQSMTGSQDMSMGCGACTSVTRCECIEQAFNISNFTYPEESAPKRPLSPQNAINSKRPRQSDDVSKPEFEELEIDFTSQFSSKPATNAAAIPSTAEPTATSPATSPDPCGFCQDGTPCICAEMAAENAQLNPLAPPRSQFTPPPSDGDVIPKPADNLQPNPNNTTTWTTNPCVNGPGTCAQCRADPQSTLFCKSLAAARSIPTSTNPTTATNPTILPCTNAPNTSTSTCCRTQPHPTRSAGLSLTCADAYTTLSRHPHYAEASDDLASWLPSLQTRVMPRGQEGRPAMEVDAANVMSVLKFFDRRFGRGGSGGSGGGSG